MSRLILQGVNSYLKDRFFKAVDKSILPANEHVLTRKKLYIFPTMRGFVFLGLDIILWLLGTNYQNNLILGLAFFLVSVFVVGILQTHANLMGLRIRLLGAEPAFAGENADFIFSVSSKKALENIELRWQYSNLSPRVVNTETSKATSVSVPYLSKRRGWLKPGRLLIESYFPLGLMRCWSYLNWDASALIYPAPLETVEPSSSAVEGDVLGEHSVKGGEDFSGLAEYRPGDPLRHVSWKSFARERGLHIKEFSQTMSEEIWLDLQTIQGLDVEQRLSGLCFWALQYHMQDKYFGLRLGENVFDPDKGENHKRRVLEALALY